MSRPGINKATWLIILFTFILFQIAQSAYAEHFKDLFPAHNLDKGGCFVQKCHAEMASSKLKFQHDPYIKNNCVACHFPEKPSNSGSVSLNQRMICAGCHDALEHEIDGSRFIHGPIKIGDCSSCHSPHQSDIKYLLKQPYNELCNICHKRERLFSGDSIHKPVKDGNCGLCHDPHASNFKSRLTDVGANLCIACHDEMVVGMTLPYVHSPLIKSGCSVCHDPHSGKDTLRLKSAADELCFTCHTDKKNEIDQFEFSHQPAKEGKCVACHSPHYSEDRSLIKAKVDDLCYECHKKNRQWQERHFQHGPVVQGNCSACHNPHGSDNAYILRLSFPAKFYSKYEKGKYNLCFICHKEVMITAEETDTVTQFRNGKTNLHRLHVNQKKGRTCRACHDVHASDQEDHIREKFRFGLVDIPIVYEKTKNGGTCVPGCHVERSYNRIKAVGNIVN